MFEWMSEHYLRLMANYEILWGYLVDCFAVDRLRTFAFILSGIFLIKLLIHHLLYRWLKKRFELYGNGGDTGLNTILQRAVSGLQLARTPDVFKFSNARPLLFTIGTLRPVIFMAPVLLEKLTDDELEAALTHELVHIKRSDTVLKWILEAVLIAIPVFIIQFFAVNFIFSTYYSNIAVIAALALIFVFRFVLWKPILFLRELSCDDLAIRHGADPVDLASSLIQTLRISKNLPRFRWQYGLAFTQQLLPSTVFIKYRIQRLLNYRAPRLKFLIGKGFRLVTVAILVGISVFLGRFYSEYGSIKVDLEYGDPAYCPIEAVAKKK